MSSCNIDYDFDGMVFSHQKEVISKTDKRCTYCNSIIPAGTTYTHENVSRSGEGEPCKYGVKNMWCDEICLTCNDECEIDESGDVIIVYGFYSGADICAACDHDFELLDQIGGQKLYYEDTPKLDLYRCIMDFIWHLTECGDDDSKKYLKTARIIKKKYFERKKKNGL